MSEQIITETATDSEEETTETVEESDETTEDEKPLGEAGQKALDAMKAERKAAREESRALKAELEKFKSELALKDKPAEEQALEAARAEARAEVTTKANERLLRSELKAAATGKMADPTDAALYLDLSTFDVSDDGDVDSDALAEAIADLIARKPHLAAGKPNRFDGGADQGAKGREAGPPQWTEADLQKADREGRSDDIAKAKAAGNLNTILGIK
jgi:hypothetical protein